MERYSRVCAFCTDDKPERGLMVSGWPGWHVRGKRTWYRFRLGAPGLEAELSAVEAAFGIATGGDGGGR